ncbi:TetR/AcrR family transcriptional regulator [Amycolatopsis ultiminotia]|uniref:TetR/AcrR family transcriptional regulator n=1 Tax=Amycolatopsis ultiminotia TaxID=543629 RepID=A0ABP6VYD3_9PSEU
MPAVAPDPGDLTARARIRDAAMAHFGEHGFDRATIRGIAETAQVSPGLVRHHFGSKQGLREACDAHLVKLIRQLADRTHDDSRLENGNPITAARTAVGPYESYLARALVEGAAAPLFDEMVELGARWLAEADRERDDPPAADVQVRAAVSTAMALSITVLHKHVSRAMGTDVFSTEGDELLARALIDLHSHPLLGRDQARAALRALDRRQNR